MFGQRNIHDSVMDIECRIDNSNKVTSSAFEDDGGFDLGLNWMMIYWLSISIT